MRVSKSNKKVHHSIRFPARINDMVEDIMILHNITDFTEALMDILIDWEKNRYLTEKNRLLELAKIRFAILENLNPKRETES